MSLKISVYSYIIPPFCLFFNIQKWRAGALQNNKTNVYSITTTYIQLYYTTNSLTFQHIKNGEPKLSFEKKHIIYRPTTTYIQLYYTTNSLTFQHIKNGEPKLSTIN